MRTSIDLNDAETLPRSNLFLWILYLPRYHEIVKLMRTNPEAYRKLYNHPGVKFMRRGQRIATVLLVVLAWLGLCMR